MKLLRIDVEKSLNDFQLCADLILDKPTTGLYGPSGAGKTTLLDCISGLNEPDRGEIIREGQVLFSSLHRVVLAPEKRRIGYVAQDEWLFPHLLVRENLRYGHDLLPPNRRRFSFEQAVELLELGTLLDRYPKFLSGGERRRVALGRAILTSPELLLLDEPLAGLDQALKGRIIPYLNYIRIDLQIPMIYVSHSLSEILELTDNIVVIEKGKVLANGSFFSLMSKPGLLPLFDRQRVENIVRVRVEASRDSSGFCRAKLCQHTLKMPHCRITPGQFLLIGIHADDIIISLERPIGMSIRNVIKGQILQIVENDSVGWIHVDIGQRIVIKVTLEAIEEMGITLNQDVYCLIKTHSIRIGPEVDQ